MLVAVWAPDSFRATRDLDLLGRGEASPKQMEALFREVCRTAVPPDAVEFFDLFTLASRLPFEGPDLVAAIVLAASAGDSATPRCPI